MILIFSGMLPEESGTMTVTLHTCSTRKVILWLLVLTATSLALQSAKALDITLDSPSQAEINEEFTVSISAATSETYDVKIFVHNSEDSQISQDEYASEIYDESSETWKNPYYYLIGTFPERAEYLIKPTRSPGDNQICLRMRKSSDKGQFEQICNSISISGGSKTSSESSAKEKNTQDRSEDEESEDENLPPVHVDRAQVDKEAVLQKNSISVEPEHRILLSSKTSDLAPLKSETIVRKTDFKTYALYGFMFLSLFLVILIALRKL